MACVRKWRGKWVVDWYDENKKRHIEKVEGGREDAEKRLAEVIKGGKKSPKNNQPFKEYSEWWLKNCAKGEIKESTYEEYESVLKNHLYPTFGSKPMGKINRKALREFAAEKRNVGLSRSTIRNIIGVMRAIYNQAVEDEDLIFNPAGNVGKLNKKRNREAEQGNTKEIKKLNTLSKKEVVTFLKKTKEKLPHYSPLFLCAFRTGLREGEMIALKPMDIDFDGRFLEVRRTYYRGRISTPKDNEARKVDMSLQLTNVLDELVAQKKAEALKREMEKPPEERRKTEEVICEVMESWLFTTPEGTQLDPDNMRKRVFYRLLDLAELRRVRFHYARHTYATLLIDQGESLAYVRDQLGHSSIQITVDTYGHLVPGGNKQAVDQLDDEVETNLETNEHDRGADDAQVTENAWRARRDLNPRPSGSKPVQDVPRKPTPDKIFLKITKFFSPSIVTVNHSTSLKLIPQPAPEPAPTLGP